MIAHVYPMKSAYVEYVEQFVITTMLATMVIFVIIEFVDWDAETIMHVQINMLVLTDNVKVQI